MKTTTQKTILSIGICMMLSCLSVVILYLYTQHANHSPNGFTRLFPPHQVSPVHIYDLGYNSYYFAGSHEDQMYLGNVTKPNHVLAINLKNQDTNHIQFNLPDNPFTPNLARVHTIGNEVYLTEGHTPVVFHSTFKERSFKPTDSTLYFLQAASLNSKTLIYKIYNGTQCVLAQRPTDSTNIRTASNLLTRQVDGLFGMDGQLLTNHTTQQVLYVYRYRNEVVVADSLLNPLPSFHTIDTLSQAQISITQLPNQETQFSAPPVIVNRYSAVSDSLLYIQSARKANNELAKAFQTHAVIDVYQINSGTYRYSFYIPLFKKIPLQAFYIHQQQLFALHGRYLVSYQLHP